MKTWLLKGFKIVNEGKVFTGDVVIKNGLIDQVSEASINISADETIEGNGMFLLPGCIDDQVHFREPGLTHKATIYTESRAAVAGGITSFMEMPNTNPQTVTIKALEDKFAVAAQDAMANHSFFFGATNDNLKEVLKVDPKTVCGVKVFMGSSTGNMLVDNTDALEELFKHCKTLIATHCEEEAIIRQNSEAYKEKYGEQVPMRCHPEIRSEEACYASSSKAVALAKKHGTRLHVLHISTAKECELFEPGSDFSKKHITAEACVHHLWFDDSQYDELGSLIKWNPAVKSAKDRAGIWEALKSDRIDVIATDHAPHTEDEKAGSYFKAPSGGPLVQHALVALLERLSDDWTIADVVNKMAHKPAELFQIDRRGFIREGYHADLVMVAPNQPWTVEKDNILYKCGWSPFEGQRFSHQVHGTFINGRLAYDKGKFDHSVTGQRMLFNR